MNVAEAAHEVFNHPILSLAVTAGIALGVRALAKHHKARRANRAEVAAIVARGSEIKPKPVNLSKPRGYPIA